MSPQLADIALVPWWEIPPDTHTHTFLTLSGLEGLKGGVLWLRQPLIPADPLIKDKIFESTDSLFLVSSRGGRHPA